MKHPHLLLHPALNSLQPRDPDAVEYLLRVLRSNGLLGASRRGFGSADVDARGAATLLLASMLDGAPQDLPRAIQVLMGLRPRREGGFGFAFFAPISKAAEAATFGDALSMLIEEAPTLKGLALDLLMLAFGHVGPHCLTEDAIDLLFSIELTVQQRPAPHASLTLRTPKEQGGEKTEFRCEWVIDGDLLARGFYDPELRKRSDLRTTATISHKTLFKIGSLIAAPADDDEKEPSYA